MWLDGTRSDHDSSIALAALVTMLLAAAVAAQSAPAADSVDAATELVAGETGTVGDDDDDDGTTWWPWLLLLLIPLAGLLWWSRRRRTPETTETYTEPRPVERDTTVERDAVSPVDEDDLTQVPGITGEHRKRPQRGGDHEHRRARRGERRQAAGASSPRPASTSIQRS